MTRITRREATGTIVDSSLIASCEHGYTGEAIERLARFEDLLEELVRTQSELAAELEMLRSQDKQKTVKFRESLGNKLVNANLLGICKRHRLL